jgi:hypothetical protein
MVYLAVGLGAFALWQITGNLAWIVQFFRVPSAILLVWLAAIQFWLSVRVCGEFSAGEPMLLAWELIAASAAFDLAGALGVQVLGAETALNPLVYLPGWSPAIRSSVYDASHILQGSCRFILLAAGLYFVLRVYRESGFLGRLRARDWALIAAFAAYVVREASDLIAVLHQGRRAPWAMILQWPVDPVLCLLLAEGLLLHRSVQRMGSGLIGRCWRTYSAGIVLVLVGDVFTWATSYGYLPWPWNSLGWYVWIPAAASFALAPAYQMEAIRWASSGQGPLTE